MKFTVKVTEFRPFRRNTLRGFATVHVDEPQLTLHDIAVHQHDSDARWVGLPAKPIVAPAATSNAPPTAVEYVRPFTFDARAVSDAFSAAVIAALLDYDQTFDREGV
jgi:hypothetical protein